MNIRPGWRNARASASSWPRRSGLRCRREAGEGNALASRYGEAETATPLREQGRLSQRTQPLLATCTPKEITWILLIYHTLSRHLKTMVRRVILPPALP